MANKIIKKSTSLHTKKDMANDILERLISDEYNNLLDFFAQEDDENLKTVILYKLAIDFYDGEPPSDLCSYFDDPMRFLDFM